MSVEKSDLLGALAERLHGSASVRTIYGEPVEAAGKTIIPVARVAYGLGGGYGSEAKHLASGKQDGKRGQGAGGGVMVHPIGVVEVTPERTRFVPLRANRPMMQTVSLVAALAIGFVAGRWYADAVR